MRYYWYLVVYIYTYIPKLIINQLGDFSDGSPNPLVLFQEQDLVPCLKVGWCRCPRWDSSVDMEMFQQMKKAQACCVMNHTYRKSSYDRGQNISTYYTTHTWALTNMACIRFVRHNGQPTGVGSPASDPTHGNPRAG